MHDTDEQLTYEQIDEEAAGEDIDSSHEDGSLEVLANLMDIDIDTEGFYQNKAVLDESDGQSTSMLHVSDDIVETAALFDKVIGGQLSLDEASSSLVLDRVWKMLEEEKT